jgi:hypothetical protein
METKEDDAQIEIFVSGRGAAAPPGEGEPPAGAELFASAAAFAATLAEAGRGRAPEPATYRKGFRRADRRGGGAAGPRSIVRPAGKDSRRNPASGKDRIAAERARFGAADGPGTGPADPHGPFPEHGGRHTARTEDVARPAARRISENRATCAAESDPARIPPGTPARASGPRVGRTTRQIAESPKFSPARYRRAPGRTAFVRGTFPRPFACRSAPAAHLVAVSVPFGQSGRGKRRRGRGAAFGAKPFFRRSATLFGAGGTASGRNLGLGRDDAGIAADRRASGRDQAACRRRSPS